MDIKHLRFFAAIVDNNFNLSHTADQLYISQPNLSIMINDFERRKNIKLFNRRGNRIVGLTLAGKHFYQDAIEVIKTYDKMNENLFKKNKKISGMISIGIPPLVLSIVFAQIMPEIILENTDINFQINEHGANTLRHDLMLENVDIAALLHPERISPNIIETHKIQEAELAIIVSTKHRLAKKRTLEWSDLHNEKFAIFDDTFMIPHLLKDKFKLYNIYLNTVLQSASWDFLVNSVKINSELITIMPSKMSKEYLSDNLVMIPIKDPIPWIVTLCRLKKPNYTPAEEYIFEEIISKANYNM